MHARIVFIVLASACLLKGPSCFRLKLPRSASEPSLGSFRSGRSRSTDESGSWNRASSAPAAQKELVKARDKLLDRLVAENTCQRLGELLVEGAGSFSLRLFFLVPVALLAAWKGQGVEMNEQFERVISLGNRTRTMAENHIIGTTVTPGTGDTITGAQHVDGAVRAGFGLKRADEFGVVDKERKAIKVAMIPYEAWTSFTKYLKTMPSELKPLSARHDWEDSYTKTALSYLSYMGLAVCAVGATGAALVGGAAAVSAAPIAVPGALVAHAAGAGHLLLHGVSYVSAVPMIAGTASAAFHMSLFAHDTTIFARFIKRVNRKCGLDIGGFAAFQQNDTGAIVTDIEGTEFEQQVNEAQAAVSLPDSIGTNATDIEGTEFEQQVNEAKAAAFPQDELGTNATDIEGTQFEQQVTNHSGD